MKLAEGLICCSTNQIVEGASFLALFDNDPKSSSTGAKTGYNSCDVIMVGMATLMKTILNTQSRETDGHPTRLRHRTGAGLSVPKRKTVSTKHSHTQKVSSAVSISIALICSIPA